MGNYGNAASLAKIGDLCGMRKSTIDKIYRQVIIAIQSTNLRTIYGRWLGKAEKEEAKK